jgi:hypothetical protein
VGVDEGRGECFECRIINDTESLGKISPRRSEALVIYGVRLASWEHG